jgi:site-specific DNA recombinase
MKLVVHNADDRTAADPGLLRIIARALDFQERLMPGLNRLCRQSPVKPPELIAKRLMQLALKLPTDWAEQRKLLGFQRQ